MIKWIKLTALWKGQKFESSPIELNDNDPNSESAKSIIKITQDGTSDLDMFKMPLSDSSYIIFSRQQLDETLIIAEIFDQNPNLKRKKERKTGVIYNNV